MGTSRSKGNFAEASYDMLCSQPYLHQRPYHSYEFIPPKLFSFIGGLIEHRLLSLAFDPILMGTSGDQLTLQYCSEDATNETTDGESDATRFDKIGQIRNIH